MLTREERFSFSAKVTYELCSQSESLNSSLGVGELENISPGGLCLVTQEPLETGQVIKIHLPMPEVMVTTPSLTEICWIREALDEGLFRIGLRFLL